MKISNTFSNRQQSQSARERAFGAKILNCFTYFTSLASAAKPQSNDE